MLWEAYYSKIDEWSASTAVSRMSSLETFGPPEEIVYVFHEIAFYNEKAASRLIKKATAAGVKFSGDQLSDLCSICDEAILHQAILASADQFTPADLDALYACCDDDFLIDISRKYHIVLPEQLADFNEAPKLCAGLRSDELREEYDTILNELCLARDCLSKAHTCSLWDISIDNHWLGIAKYAHFENAQQYLANALRLLNSLELSDNDIRILQNACPDISWSFMMTDLFSGGFWSGLFASRSIKTTLKNVNRAITAVRSLRDSIK